MTKFPDLFWGLIASMWIGNLMLLVINLPLVGLWVKLLRCRTAAVRRHRHLLLHRHHDLVLAHEAQRLEAADALAIVFQQEAVVLQSGEE